MAQKTKQTKTTPMTNGEAILSPITPSGTNLPSLIGLPDESNGSSNVIGFSIKKIAEETKNRDIHRVSLIKESALLMPELWLDVYVEGDRHEQAAFASWLIKARCTKAATPEGADLVIFTGGTDVNPELYGAERMSSTDVPDHDRDAREMLLYQRCVTQGIPMLGICRGAQFLHVMNGGKLYQHVDNHNGAHDVWDIIHHKKVQNVSSVHHQMVIEDRKNGMTVIADNPDARNRWISEGVNRPGNHCDVEAFFYRDTVCLGIQGHPEYTAYPGFSKWSLELINEFIIDNIDCESRQTSKDSARKYRRVKEGVLLERKHKLKEKTDVHVG